MSQQLFDKVAAYLEKSADSTQWEIAKGCAVGDVSEVLEKMSARGYGIARKRGQRNEVTQSGLRPMSVMVYTLTHRPQARPVSAAG
jgi:hypothetical protein